MPRKESITPQFIVPADREQAHVCRKAVLHCLEAIDPFPARKDTRKNVRMPGQTAPYKHFALGKVKVLDRQGLSSSVFNTKYPDLLRACRKLMRAWEPTFRYDCIQVNKSQRMPPHKDGNNQGSSRTIALGKFTGGELGIQCGDTHSDYKVRNKMLKFNGAECMHWVKPFKGERYSLVFFRLKWRQPK